MSTATDRAKLEDSYRRLLRLQPPAYRLAREEELLGVLIDSARPGQTRATAAETIDLLWSAARHWVALAFGANDAAASWRVMVVMCGGLAAWMVPLLSSLAFHPSSHLLRLVLWSAVCLLLVVVVGLSASRRTGAGSLFAALRDMASVTLAAVAASELTASVMTSRAEDHVPDLVRFVAAFSASVLLVHRGSALFPDRVASPLWRDACLVLTLGAGLRGGYTALDLIAFPQYQGASRLAVQAVVLLLATCLLVRPARITGRDAVLIVGAGVAGRGLWQLWLFPVYTLLPGSWVTMVIGATSGAVVAVIAGRQARFEPPRPQSPGMNTAI
jgi:hypothetical protein